MNDPNTSITTTYVGTGNIPAPSKDSAFSNAFVSGMAAFILASIDSYMSIEDWQTKGEMGFSNSFAKDSQKWSSFFLKLMDAPAGNIGNPDNVWGYSDEAAMEAILGDQGMSPEDKNSALQVVSSGLNIHNTMYNQINSNYSGLENGANQGASNANQSLGNILSGMQAITTLMQSSARST